MSGDKLTAAELAASIKEGALQLTEHGENVSRLCTKAQSEFNIFINFNPNDITKESERLAGKVGSGAELPLAGVPFCLADNICTLELKTTCGSRMLASYRPLTEDGAVRRLKEKGALLAAKGNMDEFGIGAGGRNSFFGAIKNPCNPEHTGGSGAAAAVASGAVSFSLATDRCGELRQAAAYCGVLGLKPTYGRISRQGLIDSAPSMEQAGIIARQTKDLASALSIVCGADPQDPTSSSCGVPDFNALIEEKPRSVKIALPYLWDDLAALEGEVKDAIAALLCRLEGNYFSLETVPLEYFHHASTTAAMISAVEAFSNLSNYDGVRFGFRGESKHLHDMYRQTRTEGFSSNLKKFLTFGALISSGKYYHDCFLKAQKMRSLIKDELEKCLLQYDLLVVPTVPFKAPLLGSGISPLLPDFAAYYTAAASLAGLPALTFPLKDPAQKGGLPVAGLQLIGKAWDEKTLLQVSLLLEEELL